MWQHLIGQTKKKRGFWDNRSRLIKPKAQAKFMTTRIKPKVQAKFMTTPTYIDIHTSF